MAILTKVLNDYLSDWGKHRRSPVPGLSYQTTTTEWRMYYSPGRSTKPTMGPKYEPPPHVMVVEAILQKWRTCGRSNWNNALWCRWVHDMAIEKARIVVDEYDAVLKRAQEEMADELNVRCYEPNIPHRKGWGLTGETRGRPKKCLT